MQTQAKSDGSPAKKSDGSYIFLYFDTVNKVMPYKGAPKIANIPLPSESVLSTVTIPSPSDAKKKNIIKIIINNSSI